MDHHHLSSPSYPTARYVPPPPPFSGDPNFRSSPNHHLPPPPPYQPLPPPSTYRPNPYNPQNPPPQFNFSNPNPNRPVDDDRPRSFPRRLAFQDNGRSYHENHPHHRPARPYPGPVDLDRHLSFRPSPPARRLEVFRRESEGGGSRVRDEVSDQHSQRDKYGHGHVWGQNDGHSRGGASERSGGSFGFNDEHGSSSSRGGEHGSSGREIEHGYSSSRGRVLRANSGSYVGKYELISDSEMGMGVRDEGQRWIQNRQSLKDERGQAFEMGHSEANGGYGVGGRVFSRKEEYNGQDSGRYTESVHGYVDQPRKQVQKKSALLRIQMVKPNHKNRDGEHSHYSGYYGDSNVSSIRGKDQLGYSGRGREKEEEEGSPVELDVSFKSNSLVAKPIATPPSSKVVSDANLMPRDSKIRKIATFDRECSSSPLTKSNENASRSDSVRSVVNNSPSFGKDLKQLEKKAPASGSLNTSATSSQPCCDGKNDSIVKAQVERSLEKGNTAKSGANAASGKTTTRKIVKKKIIVKRIRRKDMTPSSRLSSSQLAKKGEEPVVPDSSTAAGSNQYLKDSKEDQILVGMTSVHNVDLLQPGLKKVTVPSEGNKVGGSPQAIVSEECDNFVIPLGGTRDASTSSLDHEITIDEYYTSADASGYHLHNIVNFGDHLNSQIETTCSDGHSLENVGKQLSDSGDSILLENGGEKESQDIMFSVEGNVTSGLSCSGDMKINSVSMNMYNPSHEMNKDLGFDIGGISLAEKTAHLDICTVFDSQQLHTNDAPTILHNDSVEALPTSIATIGIKDNAATSSSVETTIHNERMNADCSEQGTDTLLGIANGSIYLEDIAASNNGTADDVCKKLSSNGVTPSLEDDAIKGSPNTEASEGGSKIDISESKKKRKVETSQLDLSSSSRIVEFVGVTPSLEDDAIKGSPNTEASEGGSKIDISESKKKRKVETSQLDLSSSSRIVEFVGVLNPFNPVQASDLTLPFNDANPAEVTVSGFESLLVNSQPNSTSGISVLNGNISINASSLSEVSVKSGGSVDPNIISPNQKNKRKISALHPGLSVNEESLITYSFRPGKEVFSEFNNGQNQEQPVAASDLDPTYAASSPPSWKRTTLLVDPNMLGGAFNITIPIRDALKDDSSEIELPNSVTCSAVQEMAIPNPQSVCPPVFGENREENSNLITAMNNHENIMDIESYRRDQLNMRCAEERARMCKETAQTRISVELQSPVIGEGFPGTDMELDSYPQGKDYLSNVPHCQSLSVEEDEISTSNSNDEPMECEPSALSNIGSPETVTVIHPLDGKLSFDEHSSEKVSGSDKELALRPLVEGLNLTTSTLLSKETQVASNSDHRIASGQSITLKTVPMLSENSKKMYHNHNPLTAESYVRKSQVSKTIPRTFQGHLPFPYTNSKKTVSSTPVTKPRTWHRNAATSLPSLAPNKAISNIVSQQKQSSEKNGKFQSTSYIRKGNSLVRKPTTVAVLAQGSDVSSTTRLKSSGVDDSKKGTGSDRIEVIDTSNVLRTGLNAMSEKPRTSTHPSSTRLPYLSTTSSGNCTPSTSAEPALSGCSEPLAEPIKFMGNGAKSSEDSLMRSATSEYQSGPISNVESQSENVKMITYVKRKSNQLVVASNSFDIADKAQGVHADGGYYKKSKNQLIRTPLESQKKADDSSIFEGQKASMVIPSRIPSKKQSHKVVAKTGKPSKFSLVWTLCGALSSSKYDRSLHREFLPRTPYKRGTSWRSFMQNAAAISNNSSLTLTRKLLLSRKMNTIYTRSKHGFSLRKSKVLSVGGSSLKWSKSIERQSKMVNEEATLAVAAADKKKREQNGAAARALTRTKNKKERIFRIGSVRYRMDSSRRTLQRISDDESSRVAASQSKNNLKKSYVPRRLLIGNDEYVRIGNGNQLVRDPKKRTRALASEKVRWSLHTARSRLAKKRKYCLFFTRFGKCNKDDGKCPYIHDPSKIAVCTKFLNGFCSDPNCKLTHEVIPERMPDCSYFLQGLCTNEKCSYRHVKVNHNSPTCEGFLKGYCADGDECRKKHSYICPVFESTGSCPQGSKCKLHHPKNRGKGKKRKQQDRQNNTQGRYFGSTCTNHEPGNMVSERHIAQTNDDISFEGNFVDYISLGVVSDDEAGESNDITSGHGTFCNSSSSDLQLHDLDSLIKPIRIMT